MSHTIEHSFAAQHMDDARRERFIKRHGFAMLAAHAAGNEALARVHWQAQRQAIMARSPQQVQKMERERGMDAPVPPPARDNAPAPDDPGGGWVDAGAGLAAHMRARFGAAAIDALARQGKARRQPGGSSNG